VVEVALRRRSSQAFLIEWRRGLDWPILIAAVILLGIGLMLSLAAGPPAAARHELADSFYYVKRHAVFAIGAVVVLFGTSLLDRVWARRLAALVFFGSLALLAFILVSGHEAKGAQRWLRFGAFTLQPSEFAKPALILLWPSARCTLTALGRRLRSCSLR